LFLYYFLKRLCNYSSILIEIIKLNNILLFLQLLTTFFETFRILRTFSRRFSCRHIDVDATPTSPSLICQFASANIFRLVKVIWHWIFAENFRYLLHLEPDGPHEAADHVRSSWRTFRPNLQSVFLFYFNFNHLLLLSLLNLILYLQLTIICKSKDRHEYQRKEEQMFFFIVT
jgi:hypothetical protein